MPTKKKGKMNTKKNKMATKKGANNNVDVTSAEHIPKLVDLLKKNKVVIVLIWADYCGHCHRYKDQVWNKLLNNK
jgi:thiol-disulfide isomerase/thioredoxin